MKIILYQDFGDSVNHIQTLSVSSRQDAALAAKNEDERLSEQGFPGIVRFCSADTWDSIEKKSEALAYKKLCQRYGKNNVVSPDNVRAQMKVK